MKKTRIVIAGVGFAGAETAGAVNDFLRETDRFPGRVGVPAREHKSSGLNRLRSPSCAPVLKDGDKGSRSRLKAGRISLHLTETRTETP
jgi:hypothetical protein